MAAPLFEPPLFADDTGKLLPLALADELFILERARISFEVKDPACGTFKGAGRVYCTTQRVIFVADKPSTQHGRLFSAFEVPLARMSAEKFNQPIFGACSLSGLVSPGDAGAPLAWRLVFRNGGTGVVLPVFLRLLDKRAKKEAIDAGFLRGQNKAFVDPNDPTVVYLAQPGRPAAAAAPAPV